MTTFRFHSEPLQDTWLDLYGHMNEAYYLVPFSNTTWIMQDHFGIGSDYFDSTGCALYTVETHLRYLNDVRAPASMDIETLVLGSDCLLYTSDAADDLYTVLIWVGAGW